jgi:hypothetical protein
MIIKLLPLIEALQRGELEHWKAVYKGQVAYVLLCF